jgi:hypothetical protein
MICYWAAWFKKKIFKGPCPFKFKKTFTVAQILLLWHDQEMWRPLQKNVIAARQMVNHYYSGAPHDAIVVIAYIEAKLQQVRKQVMVWFLLRSWKKFQI